MELKADGIRGEGTARQAGPLDRALAFFDVLLAGAAVVVEYELPITCTGEGDDLWRWPDIVARRRAVRALPDIAALIADGEVRWKP